MSEAITDFPGLIKEAFDVSTLVKLTLAKPRSKRADLKNIYIRPVEIKKGVLLSFTYRYQTKDEVKNYKIDEAIQTIEELLGSHFMRLHLFTTEKDFELSINKKGKAFVRSHPPNFTKAVIQTHDYQKKRWVNTDAIYLNRLEITDVNGKIRPSKNDKFKQINKYIEITEALIDQIEKKDELSIVDMGSGKGYLTFALYDFLSGMKGINVSMKGIEMRKELVE
ncbi:MAG: SAM-dependent methyltransferase, partial [Chlorobiales bacterium]|nr:SAM-dependent methyltransferase [Chlorobiales bacterium]